MTARGVHLPNFLGGDYLCKKLREEKNEKKAKDPTSPPFVQKRDVNNTWPQLTSFD